MKPSPITRRRKGAQINISGGFKKIWLKKGKEYRKELKLRGFGWGSWIELGLVKWESEYWESDGYKNFLVKSHFQGATYEHCILL